MEKLTFKEYLQTKEQLKKIAVETTPLCVTEYNVQKYCKIVVKEETHKLFVPLKPKSRILVEWLYANPKCPTPISIKLEGVSTIDPDEELETPWKSGRFLKWLLKHTKEN
ncbi:MAG: hypothetical protein ACREAU_00365 [Nitrosopumilaceae archaeon]